MPRAAETPGLPAPVRTGHRTFSIPFRPPEPREPEATVERVVLEVSRDLGGTWARAAETKPTAGAFTFTADDDGEYWFRLRAVDRQGRSRGGEGPDIRVLVDAADPKLAAHVWKGPDGEIVCRYAATDASLDLDSLVVEYRAAGDRGWKSIAADAVLARESPAHLVGETIWWAGEKVDQLVVRIAVADVSGNRSVRQFQLAPADPEVDQAGLARELGLPPLPDHGTTEPVAAGSGEPPDAAPAAAATAAPVTEAGRDPDWPAERSAWTPATSADRPRSGPAATTVGRGIGGGQAAGGPETEVASDAPQSDPGAGGLSGSAAGLEYRGRPLHLAGARRFAWDYEVPAVRRTAGPLRAELWTTRDGGLTWQRAAVDADATSPIEVELPAAGLYGVRLEIVADVPDAGTGPEAGTQPDAWVGIDEEPPQVAIESVARAAEHDDTLVIDYVARDPLLPANAVRLLYSPNPDGPWATIAADLANEGQHRWAPGPSVPSRVFIRVEATDAAGHTGAVATEQSISVAPTRFGGRLGGLRTVPGP